MSAVFIPLFLAFLIAMVTPAMTLNHKDCFARSDGGNIACGNETDCENKCLNQVNCKAFEPTNTQSGAGKIFVFNTSDSVAQNVSLYVPKPCEDRNATGMQRMRTDCTKYVEVTPGTRTCSTLEDCRNQCLNNNRSYCTAFIYPLPKLDGSGTMASNESTSTPAVENFGIYFVHDEEGMEAQPGKLFIPTF